MGDTRHGFGADELVGEGAPQWPIVLDRVCTLVPGTCAIIRLEPPRGWSLPYPGSADPCDLERWSSHLFTSEATRSALRAGEWVEVALGEPRRRVHALAAALHSESALVTLVHFRPGQPHPAPDGQRFASLLQALRRAWKIEEHVQQLRLARDRAHAALDHAPLALMIVDGATVLLHANLLARQLVADDPDTVRVEGGRVTAARTPDTIRLRNAVRSVVIAGAPAVTVVLTRTTRQRPLAVTVRPLPGDRGAALLVVTDPEAPPVSAETLQVIFCLTAAEARLAAALMGGATLDECAAEFGTSVHTVRSQLRRLFHKTDTSRQSELVRTLLGAIRGL